MAYVAVTRPGRRRAASHPHVTIVSSAGTVVLGCTDEAVKIAGLGSTWTSIDRPGITPLARRSGRNRMTMAATAMLTKGVGGKTVNEQMLALDKICASSATCGVSYAEAANHRWLLTEVTVDVIDREPVTNEIKHATAGLTFLVYVDEGLKVAVSRKNKACTSKAKGKTYVVKRGDTLAKIAAKVYGNGNCSALIAKLNKIRHPHKTLKVGRKLRI